MRQTLLLGAVVVSLAGCDSAHHATAPDRERGLLAGATPSAPGSYLDSYDVFAPGLNCGNATCAVYYEFVATLYGDNATINARTVPSASTPGQNFTEVFAFSRIRFTTTRWKP